MLWGLPFVLVAGTSLYSKLLPVNIQGKSYTGTGKLLIVAPLRDNFPLYSELIICPQLHTLKVNEPLKNPDLSRI